MPNFTVRAGRRIGQGSTPNWILSRFATEAKAVYSKIRRKKMSKTERKSKSRSPDPEVKFSESVQDRTPTTDKNAQDEESEDPSAVARGTINANIIELSIKFGKLFLAFLLVYYIGYFGFSTAWILLGLIMYVLREKLRKEKEFQMGIARAAAVNEKASILARVEDLPSWVYFPDTERAEWINKMLLQLWPHVGKYVKDFLIKNIEPMMQDAIKNTTKFGSFRFDTIDLGDIAPRLGGIKVYREHVSRHEIIMDVELFYSGDCNIQVVVSKLMAGIRDVQLHGTLRMIFKPLLDEMPLVGAVQYFFLNTPVVEFNLTNLADVLDMPGVGDMLRKIVTDQIAYMMVLPNKMFYKLSDNVPTKTLRFNDPAGCLRIHVIEARELMKKDVVLGFGKSDPYGIITVGAQEFRTKVINNTVDPVWDFYCEAIVIDVQGMSMGLELLDKDQGNEDEFLGRLSVDIQTIASKGEADMWIPLEEATTGQVHIRLQWLALSSDLLDLHDQQQEVETMKDLGLSTCLLMVYIDSARALPNAGKAPVEPNPMVKMVLGTQKVETLAQKSTNDPVWEESFRLWVVNPEVQELLFEVVDQRSSKSLGCLTYNVSRLLHCDDLEHSQPFHLKNAGPQSKLMISCRLRVLKSGVTVPLDVRAGSPCGSHSRSESESSRPSPARSTPSRATVSPSAAEKSKGTDETADCPSQQSLDPGQEDGHVRRRSVK